MTRSWGVAPENWDQCVNNLFPKWLRERGGIVVYENHNFDASGFGDKTFMPARYEDEDGKMHDAPDEYRPNDGLPSMRQQKVDHVMLDEFDGDLRNALACFKEDK